MRIRLYATLRPLAGDKAVEIHTEDGEPIGEVLRRLAGARPGLAGQILTERGDELLPHVQVFIAGRSIRDLRGLATPLPIDAELAIFPPVAGG